MGVKKAVDALMATIIINGSGERFNDVAAKMAIGAIKTAVAELLMTWLKVVVSKNTPPSNRIG